ncbi:MAG: hypothetical protein PHN31_02605 [Candidatus Gracilibacteria bacterium]|nr:hypothetical protein [Candidatus Gracilibacteria bacterium]
MENKFRKGLILGGILAVATVIGVAINKDGKGIADDLKEDFKSIVKNLKKNLNKLEDVSKEDFAKMVNTVVEDYCKTKKITDEAKNSIISALNNKWNEMEEEYKNS